MGLPSLQVLPHLAVFLLQLLELAEFEFGRYLLLLGGREALHSLLITLNHLELLLLDELFLGEPLVFSLQSD